jgi:hypothetical protein
VEFVAVTRNGLTLLAEEQHISDGRQEGDGGLARVWMPRELLRASPGFYIAIGDAELPVDSREIWRFYWRLSPDDAIAFMRSATSLLNTAGFPFQLKMSASRDNFGRHDSVVLYFPAGQPESVYEMLPRLFELCGADLLPGGPALTLSLAQGLSWAEDPGTGESFGWHRCRLIADGIVRAYECKEQSEEGRLRIVEDRFREERIDPEEPFVGSVSAERPDFPVLRARHRPPVRARACPERDSFLEAARHIGRRLCEEAIWYEERCTWIGAEPADVRDLDSGRRDPVYRTLGPDVYDGVAGIALFLADLYRVTGDRRARDTAAAAIKQALHRIDDIPPLDALGLYSGRLGVASAAVRVGRAIAAPELEQWGAAAAGKVMRDYDGVAGHDLMSGRAGGIVASLDHARAEGDASFLTFAIHLGDELLEAADKDHNSWSWPSAFSTDHPNLTGLSHGTSGIALALLELFVATGEPRYREGAEQAFTYEGSWFDAEAGNWPDLRGLTRRGRGRRSFQTAWCHGAPGIALSRVRALGVLGDRRYALEAETALATTATALAQSLASGIGDFSLCHGAGGNASIIADVARHLCASGAGADVDLVAAIAAEGIRAYGGPDGRWPSGTGMGESPGLMLGLAGVGHFYLRLHDPSLPSILMPPANQYDSHDGRSFREMQETTDQQTSSR